MGYDTDITLNWIVLPAKKAKTKKFTFQSHYRVFHNFYRPC